MTRNPTGPQTPVNYESPMQVSESWCLSEMSEGRYVQNLPHLLVLLVQTYRETDPCSRFRVLLHLGTANIEIERFHPAMGVLSRALHIDCKEVEDSYHRLRVLQAMAAFGLGKAQSSISILEEISTDFPSFDELTKFNYLHLMGQVHLGSEETDHALELAGQAASVVSRDPKHGAQLAKALKLFAQCHALAGQNMKALDYLYRAISLGSKFNHGFLLGDLHLTAAMLIGRMKNDPASEIHTHERVRHPAWHLAQAQNLFFEYGTLARIEDVSAQFREFGRRLSDRVMEKHILEPADQMAKAYIQLADNSLEQLHAEALQMADAAPQLSGEFWEQAQKLLRDSVQKHISNWQLLMHLERLQQNLVTSANLIGVERNRLYEVLTRSSSLAQASEEDELFSELVQLVLEMTGADAVVFSPVNELREPFICGEVTGSWASVVRRVTTSRKRLYLTLGLSQLADFSDDWFRLSERESARVMAAPVGTGTLHGVVYAEKNTASGLFSMVDLQIMEALCTQAATLVTNFHTARQLNATRTRMETALDVIGEGAISLDTDLRVVAINRAALNFLGVTNASGRKLARLPGKWPDFQKSGTTIDGQLLALPAGEVLLSARPVADEQGSCTGHILTLSELRRVKRSLERLAGSSVRYTFSDLIGKNPQFQERIKLAKLASLSDVDVLIIGESGTGKEVFAQAIHNHSSRFEMPFVGINCAAIPSELLESELFGYDEGAFTGAKKGGKPGKFELAEGGTILLDEIGDMPYQMQAKLLRVLEERRCRRIGGTEEYEVNVRVISTTNRPLEKLVAQNRFRGDLLYRLRVIQIRVPSLRERQSDIYLLAQHFLKRYAQQLGKKVTSISKETKEALESYTWPGNIRELEHLMEASVHMLDDNSTVLDRVDFMTDPDSGPTADAQSVPAARKNDSPVVALREKEEESIIHALKQFGGSVTKAASALGVTRATIYNKMARYDIDPFAFRARRRKD